MSGEVVCSSRGVGYIDCHNGSGGGGTEGGCGKGGGWREVTPRDGREGGLL